MQSANVRMDLRLPESTSTKWSRIRLRCWQPELVHTAERDSGPQVPGAGVGEEGENGGDGSRARRAEHTAESRKIQGVVRGSCARKSPQSFRNLRAPKDRLAARCRCEREYWSISTENSDITLLLHLVHAGRPASGR